MITNRLISFAEPMWAEQDVGTAADLHAEAAARVQRLSPSEALTAVIARGAVLIDCRCSADIAAEGVVPGAIRIPRTVLEWRADRSAPHHDSRLITGARLIVMCNDGYSSTLAAANLVRLGHEGAADVVGGFRAWKAAGLPVAGGR